MGNWIVCCQGSTQLLTAAAAVKAYASTVGVSPDPRRIVLLIYDLACPSSRLHEFRTVIGEIAKSVLGWTNVVVLDATDAAEAIGAASVGADDRLRALQAIDPKVVDVVFSCRDITAHDKEVMDYFRSAIHVCYGDSVGIYTDRTYLSGAQNKFSIGIIQKVLRVSGLPRVVGLSRLSQRALRPSGYEIGFFTQAHAGGCIPTFRARCTDVVHLVSSYLKLANQVENTPLGVRLLASLPNAKSLAILLTSTQSEWGRATEDNEIEAYVAFVQKHVPGGTLALKPHPRESPSKISRLTARLRDCGYTVIDVGEIEPAAALPVEVILLIIMKRKDLTVLATTSAAYGAALVCGIRAILGFGGKVAKLRFNKEYRRMRIDHEKLLAAHLQSFIAMNRRVATPSVAALTNNDPGR